MSRLMSLLILTLCSATAFANDTEDCVRTKIWDTYGDGWSVRTSTTADLEFGKTKFYRSTLLEGRQYRILSCAEEGVKNLDVLLYDKDGQVLTRDDTDQRDPMLSFSPEATGVYYVVLYLRDASGKAPTAQATWALIHSDKD